MSDTQGTAVERARELYQRLDRDPSGIGRAILVFAIGAALSVLLWYPLGLPSEAIRNVVAQPTAICRGGFEAFAEAGTPKMYVCSFGVAIMTMLGPVIILALAFVFRRTLSALVARITQRLPVQTRTLIGPILATLIFAMAWSGSHYQTSWLIGLVLPQTMFPAVVGVFTYAVGRWGADFQRRLAPFFDLRDRFPMKARVAAAVLAPLIFAFLLTAETRVSLTAQKEQLIVLFGLASGFLALAPRRGDVLSGVSRQLESVAQDVNAATRSGIARARAGRQ